MEQHGTTAAGRTSLPGPCSATFLESHVLSHVLSKDPKELVEWKHQLIESKGSLMLFDRDLGWGKPVLGGI